MKLSIIERRKLNSYLERGEIEKVESLITKLSREDPRKKVLLGIYYLETENYEKALNVFFELLRKEIDNPLNLYYLTLSLLKTTESPTVTKNELIKIAGMKNLVDFVNGVIELYFNELDIAKNHFISSAKTYEFAKWGIIEVELRENNLQETNRKIGVLEKLWKKFPPAILTGAKVRLYKNEQSKAISLLKKYINLNPFDKDARVLLATTLSYKKPLIFKKKWKEAIVKNLSIKALLEPVKLENLWIYRVLQSGFASLGMLEKSMKWAIIEEKLIITLIESISSEIVSTSTTIGNGINENIETLIEILEEKDILTKKEFEKVITKKREIKIIKDMYDIAADEQSQDGDL